MKIRGVFPNPALFAAPSASAVARLVLDCERDSRLRFLNLGRLGLTEPTPYARELLSSRARPEIADDGAEVYRFATMLARMLADLQSMRSTLDGLASLARPETTASVKVHEARTLLEQIAAEIRLKAGGLSGALWSALPEAERAARVLDLWNIAREQARLARIDEAEGGGTAAIAAWGRAISLLEDAKKYAPRAFEQASIPRGWKRFPLGPGLQPKVRSVKRVQAIAALELGAKLGRSSLAQ